MSFHPQVSSFRRNEFQPVRQYTNHRLVIQLPLSIKMKTELIRSPSDSRVCARDGITYEASKLLKARAKLPLCSEIG